MLAMNIYKKIDPKVDRVNIVEVGESPILMGKAKALPIENGNIIF